MVSLKKQTNKQNSLFRIKRKYCVRVRLRDRPFSGPTVSSFVRREQ